MFIFGIFKPCISNFANCERFFLKTFVLSIVNIPFVSFSPYLRFFLNDVFNLVWKSPHLRRWKKTPQTPIKSNKVKSNRKPAPKKKSSCKCEAEEIYQQNQKNFEKQGWKTEISDTKAREEIRRLKSELRSVGCFVTWNFHFPNHFFALYVLLQRIL